MKLVRVLALVLVVVSLAACNMQNNGETPPASELPAPYATPQPASTAPASTPPVTATSTSGAAPGGTVAKAGSSAAAKAASTH